MNNDQQILNVLTQKGVLANVQIRYWRACKKLHAEDIGLSSDVQTSRLISLGHKKLLPKDALQPFALIESRAHAAVEKASFAFLGGIARFVPNRCMPALLTQLRSLEEEFEIAKVAFLNSYGAMRDESLDEWREAANKLSDEPDRLFATIAAAFPSSRDVVERFGFQTHLYQIHVPEELRSEEVNQVEYQARQDAAQESGARIRQQVDLFVRDAVATMREQTAKLCEDMLRSMETGQTGVHQKTLNRLARFIDEFSDLNFADDVELEQMLTHARSTLLSQTAEAYRDDRFARDRLVDGLSALAGKARDLVHEDARELVTRFGQLGRRTFQPAA